MTGIEEVGAIAGAIGALKKLKGMIWKPKKSKPLKDHSKRQTNVFSKVDNSTTIVLNDPKNNQKFVADIDDIPEEALDVIKRSFDRKDKTEKLPHIRIIKSEFEHEINDYQKYFNQNDKILSKILPYLESDFASILKLSSYVDHKFKKGGKKDAMKIKEDIGNQYGSYGRRLCNLYLKGYITQMLSSYLDVIFESSSNKREIGIHLNSLMRELIKFSESVYFIHNQSEVIPTADEVVHAMRCEKRYIAMHSAGSKAIGKVEEIIAEIGIDTFQSYGYEINHESSRSTSSVPFFDVYIVPKLE
ncbi:MAG: hypothetical protein U9R75_03385 [Candidatus Thermoplasmatota archaeon]|nr:hypothetical protein [Candidatus Thermoplasmatota archaeon]